MNISGLLRRVLKLQVNPATPSQQAQVESLADELHSDVEVLETYGFSAVAPPSVTEGLACFVAGQSDHGVILGWFDKAHRPRTLKPGEVQVYSKFEQYLYFDELGQVTVKSQSGSTLQMLANGDIVAAPSSGVYKITGNLQVSQSISAGQNITTPADVSAGSVSLKNHTHLQNDGSHFGGGVNTGVAQ